VGPYGMCQLLELPVASSVYIWVCGGLVCGNVMKMLAGSGGW
jgi:hypothetical protein